MDLHQILFFPLLYLSLSLQLYFLCPSLLFFAAPRRALKLLISRSYYSSFQCVSSASLHLPTVSTLPLSLHLSPLPHFCLHSSHPRPCVSLPALRMCAALHGQRAPRPISVQSPGNTKKLLDTYSWGSGGGQEVVRKTL